MCDSSDVGDEVHNNRIVATCAHNREGSISAAHHCNFDVVERAGLIIVNIGSTVQTFQRGIKHSCVDVVINNGVSPCSSRYNTSAFVATETGVDFERETSSIDAPERVDSRECDVKGAQNWSVHGQSKEVAFI